MNLKRYKIRSKTRVAAIFVLFVLLSVTGLQAARKAVESTPPEVRLKWYQQHVDMTKNSMFNQLNWQLLGPMNVSGRMTDVAVVAPKGKNYTIYVAGASGGVWKTENEGVTWNPIFQRQMSTSIGDIELAPSNQDIIWVGTGEANIFRSSQAGAGIFKSVDAGKTWEHMGLIDTNTIARILIHPQNPDIVYVAASGHEWTNNKERGVYKTVDGGKNWKKILYINDKTGAIDLVMDPTDPDTIYAATWQRIRLKWNDPRNEPNYTGSGIYKTTDAGANWQPINNGLPPAKWRGRIGLDLCKTKPNIIYAFVDNYEVIGQWEEGSTDSYGRPKMGKIKGATLYRSDDSGKNWRQVSSNTPFMEGLSSTYGWVFGQMRVDPNLPDRVYVMGLALNVSDDSGKTFRRLPGMHGDHHGLWIDPENSDYLVNVNDGGVAISYDAGKKWRTFYDNLPLVQFFNVMYDMATPFHVYGSIQDHGSYRSVVDLKNGRNQIEATDWESAPGGEGSSHAIDPIDTNTVYSAGFYGSFMRTDMAKDETKMLVPKPAKGEPPYRGQWLAPFIISPHNPRVIYHGMNFLFRSMDRGDKWERISPDLSFNNKNKIGDIQYQTIFTISESPFKFGLIYVGTDDGRVHVTHNGGIHWTELTQKLPQLKWISRIQASFFEKGTVYLTQNGKRDDDFAVYVYKSTDYGKTWKDISGNIPTGPVNVIREDPKNKNILYVGTDFGVYVTLDGGKQWHVLAGNFPTTYVHDLVIHPRDSIMVAATHGRGMYAMDVSNLQKMTASVLSKPVHLFEVEDAKLPKRRWWYWTSAKKAFVFYYLKNAADVKLSVKDKNGNVVNELEGTGNAGLNVAVWDLSKKKGKDAKPTQRRLPWVGAGEYTIELTSGDKTFKTAVQVEK